MRSREWRDVVVSACPLSKMEIPILPGTIYPSKAPSPNLQIKCYHFAWYLSNLIKLMVLSCQSCGDTGGNSRNSRYAEAAHLKLSQCV